MSRLVPLLRGIGFAFGWLGRHRRYCWVWMASFLVALVLGRGQWPIVMLGAVVPTIAATWATYSPTSYEQWIAGPGRRRAWRRWITRNWDHLARQCGLSRQVPVIAKIRGPRGWERVERMVWQAPELVSAQACENTLTVCIAAAPGQTLSELGAGAERLATSAGAQTFQTREVGPREVELSLTMLDQLVWPVEAVAPVRLADPARVALGRTSTGAEWRLQLAGRHTLVVGCSGSGKGSALWGVCGGLAPAVADDRVRLWGVDLKRGIELGMGQDLFSAVAFTPDDGLKVLRALLAVIDVRGAAMVGKSRLHAPSPGDPTHVLVIDELAALTAYGDAAATREANRLLGEILTQGRALGVVVLACVQDPRKEVVGLRGLFTQTVAMRLRSAIEVSMVLGDGMSDLAPAHRISPSYPGTAWVVEEDGTCTKVRADYWPDALVQRVASNFPSPVKIAVSIRDTNEESGQQSHEETRQSTPRKPRTRRGRSTTPEPGEAA